MNFNQIFNNSSKLSRFYSSSRFYSTKTQAYDICIIGGGPVGFGFASLLASSSSLQSKKILLVESQRQKSYKQSSSFSSRTVALSPATKRLLLDCGAWSEIEKLRIRNVKKMFVWEQTSDSFVKFEKQDDTDLAYIVENEVLQEALCKGLVSSPNVEVRFDTKVTGFDVKSGRVGLQLSDGSDIDTSLLVGSDGYNSQVRQATGIKCTTRHYDQKAVVTVVKFENKDDNYTAWQRFTRDGPIAYLPLDEKHSNLIWSTSTANADRLLRMDEVEFTNELNSEMFTEAHRSDSWAQIDKTLDRACPPTTLHHRPPKVTGLANERASFPLGFMHSDRYVGPRTALLGDAAHRLLPLAGQGVNLGFGDAGSLAALLARGASAGQSMGDPVLLQQYETERQRYVLPIAITVTALHELYVTRFAPFVWARALGLKVVNSVPAIKNWFLTGATEGKIVIFGRSF